MPFHKTIVTDQIRESSIPIVADEFYPEIRLASIQEHILPQEPIPQIIFGESSFCDRNKGRKMLEICLDKMMTKVRKLKSLEDIKPGKLAGKMGVVINLVTRLPIAIWFLENPHASDTHFEANLLELASPQTLLLLDRGFYHFQFWQTLIEGGVDFITLIKINAAIEYQQIFTNSYGLRDRLSLSSNRVGMVLQSVEKLKIQLNIFLIPIFTNVWALLNDRENQRKNGVAN